MINKEYKDVDPQETLEWIESIKSIIDTSGRVEKFKSRYGTFKR